MFWVLKRTVSLRHMFLLRNNKMIFLNMHSFLEPDIVSGKNKTKKVTDTPKSENGPVQHFTYIKAPLDLNGFTLIVSGYARR